MAARPDSIEKQQQTKPKADQQTQMQVCFRNVPLIVPAHSCGPLRDMGKDVTTELTKTYELTAGQFFVTQKNLTLPLRGMTFSITDDENDSGPSPRVATNPIMR